VASAPLATANEVIFAGGVTTGPALGLVEAYSTSTGQFSTIGMLTPARFDAHALAWNGGVIVAGGQTDFNKPTPTLSGAVDLVSAANAVTQGPALSTARAGFSMSPLTMAGTVIAIGGSTASGYSTSTEILKPNGQSWAPGGNLHVARHNHRSITLDNGEVLVVGGYNDANYYLGSTELSNNDGTSFSLTGSLATGREPHRHRAAVLAWAAQPRRRSHSRLAVRLRRSGRPRRADRAGQRARA
jgi:hypothetical protein